MRHFLFGLLTFMSIAFLTSGCTEAFDENSIVQSIQVSPGSIVLSEQGMTDEFFDVTVKVSIDTGRIDSKASSVFITDNQGKKVPGVAQEKELTKDSIVFKKITKAWVQGFPTGTYNVGVTLVTDTSTIVYDEKGQGVLKIGE